MLGFHQSRGRPSLMPCAHIVCQSYHTLLSQQSIIIHISRCQIQFYLLKLTTPHENCPSASLELASFHHFGGQAYRDFLTRRIDLLNLHTKVTKRTTPASIRHSTFEQNINTFVARSANRPYLQRCRLQPCSLGRPTIIEHRNTATLAALISNNHSRLLDVQEGRRSWFDSPVATPSREGVSAHYFRTMSGKALSRCRCSCLE
jgi:hypothetical protein